MSPQTAGLPVHHQLLELAETHVHWAGDAIQPSRPLSTSRIISSCFPSPLPSSPSLWLRTFWLFSTLHYYKIECNFPCYTVNPCCLSILCIVSACMLSCFSHVWLFRTPWTVAYQVPLFVKFPRQEYWSGLSFPPTGDLPNPGNESVSPAPPELQVDSLLLNHQGSPLCIVVSADPILLIYPPPPSPLVTISLFCLWVSFCFVCRFTSVIS